MTATADPTSKVKRNAEIASKSLHTYVYTVISLVASLVVAIGPQLIASFIQEHWALAAAVPIATWAMTIATALVPQNIRLAVDKQQAARDFLLNLIGKIAPGQPVSLPPEIAKATGLPDVVHAPINPAPVDVSLPMPGTAVMGGQPPAFAATEPSPAPEPPAFDIRSQLSLQYPGWTAAQLDAAVIAYQNARPS